MKAVSAGASKNRWSHRLNSIVKTYWFMFGLIGVFLLTIGDPTGILPAGGQWLRAHKGPDIVIFIIFLFSGLLLDAGQVKSGLTDLKGVFIALFLIFIIGPLLAVLPGLTPLDDGVKIGLFLVAVMPTTLSSGIVMTGTAGGNMAHALFITILSNVLSVFTIPITLSVLLGLIGGSADVVIDQAGIIIKLSMLVIVPLFLGMFIKLAVKDRLSAIEKHLQRFNQIFILMMVWMALSDSRSAFFRGSGELIIICILCVLYHGVLLTAAGASVRLMHLPKGRRESVILMGAQKTLTLSVILQVSLFPTYGIALVVCVLHHIIHMIMDGWVSERLRRRPLHE